VYKIIQESRKIHKCNLFFSVFTNAYCKGNTKLLWYIPCHAPMIHYHHIHILKAYDSLIVDKIQYSVCHAHTILQDDNDLVVSFGGINLFKISIYMYKLYKA